MQGLPQQRRSRKGTNKYALYALLAVLLVGGFFLLQKFDWKAPPKGDIYLSLYPLPTDENASGIFAYSFDTDALGEVVIPYRYDDTYGEQYITGKFSPDGTLMAMGVHNFVDETAPVAMEVRDESGSIWAIATSSDLMVRRNPVWSPYGGIIAYMARSTLPESDSINMDGWGIYLLDIETNEEWFLTDGINPLFAPDGRLLVLESDGLYLYDLDEMTYVKVWNLIGGGGLANMKLNVSNDGRFIAWATPHDGTLNIIEVVSWEPFVGNEYRIIEDTTSFWPVFSPDGNYLAVQEVDVENDVEVNPRLVIYDLDTFEKETVFDLSNFYQQAMFVTDWR